MEENLSLKYHKTKPICVEVLSMELLWLKALPDPLISDWVMSTGKIEAELVWTEFPGLHHSYKARTQDIVHLRSFQWS